MGNGIGRRDFLRGLVGLASVGAVGSLSGGCADAIIAGGAYHYGKYKAREEMNREGRENNDEYKFDGKIVIQRWKDDGNKLADPEELLGDIGDSVNLSNVSLLVSLNYCISPSDSVLYTLLNSSDETIFECDSNTHAIVIPQGGLKEGIYTLHAGHLKGYSRKFTVTR